MKRFYVPNNNNVKVLFLLCFVFFAVLTVIRHDPYILIPSIACAIYYFSQYAVRNICVEVEDNKLRIIKLPSKVLGQSVEEVLFSDIVRINTNSSKSQLLTQIRLKNKMSVYIPKKTNPEFDKFILELDEKLRNENEEYNIANSKKDKHSELYRIFMIIMIINTLIVISSVILSPHIGTTEGVILISTFILLFTSIMLFVTHK